MYLTKFYKLVSGRRSTSYLALSYTETMRADPSSWQELIAVYADQQIENNASGIDNKSLYSCQTHAAPRENVWE